jgi:hypothetical protein
MLKSIITLALCVGAFIAHAQRNAACAAPTMLLLQKTPISVGDPKQMPLQAIRPTTAPAAAAMHPVFLPQWTSRDLPVFCRIEHQFAQKMPLTVKFRLGSVEYVDWLEYGGGALWNRP